MIRTVMTVAVTCDHDGRAEGQGCTSRLLLGEMGTDPIAAETPTMLRAAAAARGWAWGGHGDLCPKHRRTP